jgi:hypothetical protein
LLRDGEINYLNHGLRLEMPPALQKRTLQRLCEWYEHGRRMADPTHSRQLIHSLMASPDILVRRWSMKALALIGHPDDFQRIVARLRVEDDLEAQSWGITGLVKNARDRGLKDLCEIANLPNSSAFTLAARLYAPHSWIANYTEAPRISLDDDELTLKWATFLIGYGRAPEDLFHPKFSNEVFLGELNAHDAPDISEYSVWALWERPEFGAAYSKIPLEEAKGHPESVRKWLYRLATKSPDQAGLDPEGLAELRLDPSARAREGLALGVSDLAPSDFGREVLDWYTVEGDAQVRENLLVSMAARSAELADYSDAIEQQFAKEAADSPTRRRLLAASEGLPLYSSLRGLDIAAERARQGLLEYGQSVLVMGDYKVSGPTLNVGGNLQAQNLAVGDMINSANAAVQQLENSDRATAQVLQQVLSMLAAARYDAGRADVAAAVQQVANAPTPESKKTLIDRLKAYGATAAAAGTAIAGIDKVITAVQGLPL